jgi:Zn finger protein HypA/HybF involved in hydrogenase expression
MELFIFGFICLLVVGIIAFILAFKERIKDDRKANQNLIVGNLEDSDIELSEALDNLQIYNSSMENINTPYKTIHFLCKHCKNEVLVNFQFLDSSVIESANFTVKCPLCNKLITTVEIKDGMVFLNK